MLFNKTIFQYILGKHKDLRKIICLKDVSIEGLAYFLCIMDNDSCWAIDPESDRDIGAWDDEDTILVELDQFPKDKFPDEHYRHVFFNIDKNECIKIKRVRKEKAEELIQKGY